MNVRISQRAFLRLCYIKTLLIFSLFYYTFYLAERVILLVSGVLAENHRFNLVSEISDIFSRLMRAEKGEVPASVTTAQALDSKQRDEVMKALKKFVKPKEKIVLEEKVRSLVGSR